MKEYPILRDTVVEINLDNMRYNIQTIKKLVDENVSIAAVVKANAYGHGSIEVSKFLIENGIDYLAVATLTEAIEIRKSIKDHPILIMGYTQNENLKYIEKYNLTQTIFSLEQGKLLSELGKENDKLIKVHIKYDTGFNRLGFKDSLESINSIEKICNLDYLDVEGIFTHLALRSKENDYDQFDKFNKAIKELNSRKIYFKYKHLSDSIAAVRYPEFHLDMIRPGAIIYGLKSIKEKDLVLKPVMTFKTRITNLKTISAGEMVSYDDTWVATKDTFIATLPFGYADGYPRSLSRKGTVTIKGKKATILGVICMDQCMVDVSHIPDVKVGDEVIIFSDGSNNTISIQDLSVLANTNKNDIVSRISRRAPRIYVKNGEVIKIKDYLIEGDCYEHK